MSEKTSISQRLDLWLWYARFFKSRSLATKICRAHRVRINGTIHAKASVNIKVGDILTFPQGQTVRAVRVEAFGDRRGPANEAQALYHDMAPEERQKDDSIHKDDKAQNFIDGRGQKTPARPRGDGRPTKRDRRAYDRLRDKFSDETE